MMLAIVRGAITLYDKWKHVIHVCNKSIHFHMSYSIMYTYMKAQHDANVHLHVSKLLWTRNAFYSFSLNCVCQALLLSKIIIHFICTPCIWMHYGKPSWFLNYFLLTFWPILIISSLLCILTGMCQRPNKGFWYVSLIVQGVGELTPS